MPVADLYRELLERFPALSKQVGDTHIQHWGESPPVSSHLWFESLANVLNEKMRQGVPAERYHALFGVVSARYEQGDEEERECIDVSLIENLFWEVNSACVEPYWRLLPENLKQLYIAFHQRGPNESA